MATSDDLTALAAQLTAVEASANAVLRSVAQARATLAALDADTSAYNGGY